jgi:hypothetical protein
VRELNEDGCRDIVISDSLTDQVFKNLCGLKFQEFMTPSEFQAFVSLRFRARRTFSHVFYLGGWEEENFAALKSLFGACLEEGGRFISISSASTMGRCLSEDRNDPEKFRPATRAGMVSSLFDRYFFQKAGHRGHLSLKYYQLHGPENPALHSPAGWVGSCLAQMNDGGTVRLPSALRPDTEEGRRQHDFLPVAEAAKRVVFLAHNRLADGIYELGSGRSVTAFAYCEEAFAAAGKPLSVAWDDAASYDSPPPEPESARLERLEKTGWRDVSSAQRPISAAKDRVPVEAKASPQPIAYVPMKKKQIFPL